MRASLMIAHHIRAPTGIKHKSFFQVAQGPNFEASRSDNRPYSRRRTISTIFSFPFLNIIRLPART
jgi:hypothetical protein